MRQPVRVVEPPEPKRQPVRLPERPAQPVYWYYSSENASPRVTAAFLATQRRLLLPLQYAREHQNSWQDAMDSLVAAADVDVAMNRGWVEPHRGDPAIGGYIYFIDLGAVHDPTVIAIGHLDALDQAVIDKLLTFQGSREQPVQLARVEAVLLECCAAFPPGLIRVESWQGLGSVQRLLALGLPVELFTPTQRTNSEEWPILVRRFSDRTLILPTHDRLREELLNLSYDVTPTGIRVTDKGKVHQDHAVAVRGVVAALQPWVLGDQIDPTLYETLSPEEVAFQHQVHQHFNIDDPSTHPDFVPDDTGQDYANRDMRWSRLNADGSRTPLW